GVRIDLHVVVEYGLNLAEVASTVRNRVAYEVERLTGLAVAEVEVHIEDVRRSA
ncbi:MAG: Asp23 family, cell envelope-related function, partial [Gaiellaceae bacterium]|nr:Asp23 family, cell envelope-related function [Gaiellaceae bacterium]